MNNEEKILAMLAQMQGDIANMKSTMVTREDLNIVEERMTKELVDVEERMIKRMDEGFASSEERMIKRIDEGFEKLETLINVAAKDAARTERRLEEHLLTPHIA